MEINQAIYAPEETTKYVELFRIDVTPKEANGIKNCSGYMWDSYVGGIVRRAGQQLPEGVTYSSRVENNQLIISVPIS